MTEIKTLDQRGRDFLAKEEGSGIYKITSPVGRVYIGKALDLKRRKSEYKYLKCKTQHFVYRSILKYGFDSHIFEVIENCPADLLNAREVYYIALFKTNNCRYPDDNGMNCTDGGEGSYGFKHTNESKRRMSDKQKQLRRSSESNLKRSATLKGRPIPPNCLKKLVGSKQSEEHKAKRIQGLFRKVINTDTGHIYNSVREAAETNNINRDTLKGWLSGRYPNKSNLILYHE